MKKRIQHLSILACSFSVLLASEVLAAQETSATNAPTASTNAPTPAAVMEQKALDDLKRMSDALSAAKSFTFRIRSTVEVPAKTGQMITLFATSELALQRPDKLRAMVRGEVPNFDFYYDGRSIAAYSPKNNVYSMTNAPNTIDALLPFVEERTGIHFPAADVMFSDPYVMLTKGLTSAFVVGSSLFNDVPCEHLAFMAPGVNWEIWIEAGPRALPLCLAVTYADVANFPRFLVEFSDWNLQPNLTANDFVFKKPADAKEIPFRPAGQLQAQPPK
jgi:hypothetical protein